MDIMKCDLCKLNEARKKYCSKKCIKRAWYLKNSEVKASYGRGDKDFWKTATGIGFRWERYAAKRLDATHLEFNMGVGDLKWRDKIIDVKAAHIYRRKNRRGKPVISEQKGCWVFNKNKEKNIDFFFCVCLIDNKVIKELLIPAKEFKGKGITVGWTSKYDQYMFK